MPSTYLPYRPPEVAIDVLPDEQLWTGARNVGESSRPRPGYPAILPGYPEGRLFMDREAVLAATTYNEVWPLSDGTLATIYRVSLPPGHDTQSPERSSFLSAEQNVGNLIYPPVDDIVTGDNERVDPVAFQRWLDMGYRVFDQHDRVLPGSFERVMQLLGLRSQGRYGRQLGMPVGNGTFASPGPHPAGDAFVLMPLPQTNDLATLVWAHASNEQAHEVWVPPGGFGSRADIVGEQYSSWQTTVRQCRTKTEVEIGGWDHWPVHNEFALSSPTTINSALISEGHAVLAPYSDEWANQVLDRVPTGDDIQGHAWLSLKALIRANTEMRQRGARPDADPSVPDHVYWDTHMRGLAAAVSQIRSVVG